MSLHRVGMLEYFICKQQWAVVAGEMGLCMSIWTKQSISSKANILYTYGVGGLDVWTPNHEETICVLTSLCGRRDMTDVYVTGANVAYNRGNEAHIAPLAPAQPQASLARFPASTSGKGGGPAKPIWQASSINCSVSLYVIYT